MGSRSSFWFTGAYPEHVVVLDVLLDELGDLVDLILQLARFGPLRGLEVAHERLVGLGHVAVRQALRLHVDLQVREHVEELVGVLQVRLEEEVLLLDDREVV